MDPANQTPSSLENIIESSSSSSNAIDPATFIADYDILMDDKAFPATSSMESSVFEGDQPSTTTASSANSASSLPERQLQKEKLSENLLMQQELHNQERPKLVDWTPREGHVGDTMTVVMKQQNQQILPMKLIFNHLVLETSEQHQQKGYDMWVTLSAKVPSLQAIQQQEDEKVNQASVSICCYDVNKQHALDHWIIGTFTYYQGSKRAAEPVALNADINVYAKKPHTALSEYINSDVDFGHGDIMNLLPPYNTSPGSQALYGKPPSPAAEALPKAVSMPNMHRQSGGNYDMFQNSKLPSPSAFQEQQRATPPSSFSSRQQHLQPGPSHSTTMPYNPPQIVPRSSSMPFPVSQQPSSSYYNSSYAISSNDNGGSYTPLDYSSYQDPSLATSYMQQPNTASADYMTPNYFPASHQEEQQQKHQQHRQQQQQHQQQQQYNYGQRGFLDHPNIVPVAPITPPVQHKRLPRASQQHHSQHYRTGHPYAPLAEPSSQPFAGLVSRPQLNIHNDLMEATRNWTPKEWEMRRRVIRFWRQQRPDNPQQIDCGYEVVDEEAYRAQRMQQQQQHQQRQQKLSHDPLSLSTSPVTAAPSTVYNYRDNLVVSCIYWQERNDYFITSVDCIQLIEGLIGVEFTVEEKNRIRRNLEALRPLTAAKTRAESVDFFKLIMGFPAPKPRNIEKDVKVFLWSTLGPAIKKIIGKYTPSYSSTLSVTHFDRPSSLPSQQQQPNTSISGLSR